MHLQKLTTRFISFNLWANERLTTWLLSGDRDVLSDKTGSSFRTIDLTLQHILSAQLYWYALLAKGQLIEFNKPARKDEVEEVVADLIKSSHDLIDVVAELKEEQLIETLQVSDSRQSKYEYILHLVNHGTYHRGQVVTMCRALGVTDAIPPTDYDAYLWWLENKV